MTQKGDRRTLTDMSQTGDQQHFTMSSSKSQMTGRIKAVDSHRSSAVFGADLGI